VLRSTWGTAPWWKSIGGLALSLAIGLGLLAAVMLFARPLALLFLAICIAAALSPIVEKLSSRLPRTAAILLTYAVLLVCLIVILMLVTPPLFAQFNDLRQQLPAILERIQQSIEESGLSISQLESLTSGLGQFGRNIVTLPIEFASAVLDAVLVMIVSLYLLMDGPRIRDFFLSLFGRESREQVEAVGGEIIYVLGGYVRGIVIDMVLVGTLTTIGLTLIGLPFALVLGAVAGIFEVLPVIGSLLATIPVLTVAVLQDTTTFLITFVFIVVVQLLEGNVITPNIMNDQANVPRFIVPLVILAGATVGGVLRVLFLRIAAPFIRRHTGAVEDTKPEPAPHSLQAEQR
jgi:predicted PurR-regulated permease PerM